MRKSEFILKVIGVPWENRRYSFESMDCYGLVLLYYKYVLKIELGIPPCYTDGYSIDKCWDIIVKSGNWYETERPSEDGILMSCHRSGLATHVGVTIGNGKVIHCFGSESMPGKVQINSISSMKKIFGDITFHKYMV